MKDDGQSIKNTFTLQFISTTNCSLQNNHKSQKQFQQNVNIRTLMKVQVECSEPQYICT